MGLQLAGVKSVERLQQYTLGVIPPSFARCSRNQRERLLRGGRGPPFSFDSCRERPKACRKGHTSVFDHPWLCVGDAGPGMGEQMKSLGDQQNMDSRASEHRCIRAYPRLLFRNDRVCNDDNTGPTGRSLERNGRGSFRCAVFPRCKRTQLPRTSRGRSVKAWAPG